MLKQLAEWVFQAEFLCNFAHMARYSAAFAVVAEKGTSNIGLER